MAGVIRAAFVGGTEIIRSVRREALTFDKSFSVVYDSDGFNLDQQEFLNITFDVAIIDQRLSGSSGFDFISSIQAVAKVTGTKLGNFLLSSAFQDESIRLQAIDSGAVEAVAVSEGLEKFVELVRLASDPFADFAAREIISSVQPTLIDSDRYRLAERTLEILDDKEQSILRAFCDLKSDAEIAQIVKVPKLKVRNTIEKTQDLLMLNTRSQLILQMRRFGAIYPSSLS